MAVYVIAVFLCRMDDGSGHDYASDDEHLSLSSPSSFQCHFGSSSPKLASYLQMLAKEDGYDMKKRITLDLHIAMFIFDIMYCFQFT